MPTTPIGLLRGFCLLFGVIGLLFGTVLFPVAQRFLHAWFRMSERIAGPQASASHAGSTRVLLNPTVMRGWQLFCAAIGLGLWWYLGTAHGAAFVESLRPH